MPLQHARLSASGAHRWLHCTPSIKLEENYPSSTSIYAEEGTVAHELAETKLMLEYEKISKKIYNARIKKIQKSEYYNSEMEDYIQSYVDNVIELVNDSKAICDDVIVMLEERLDFSEWVPEGFGTGDVIVISDGILQVIDLKYGKGLEVSAIENPQLRLYGLGSYNQFEMLYDIDLVKTTIIQPRLDNISSEEIEVTKLLTWGEDVKKKAQMAFNGEGDFVSGDHCGFCRAKNDCRKRAEDNLEKAKKYDFADTFTLNEYEIADILGLAKNVQDWLKDVQSYALEQAEKHGVKYPGYKLVEGRSNRKYVDEQEVANVLLSSDYEEDKIYKPRVLKGITDMEKAIGKKDFVNLLNDLIIKPVGKATLVLESDKRPEINSIDSAKKDFGI
ncbi:DUF2800 domain-containing protein [Clostridioides sp. ES-W-0016-02]|uniref:DUF2800 domain-containing protein n=1 Tax=Clostridioides sp. ES-W-0016-02 TaxID=2770788 RepID=UPI001D107AB3|nr:DUF2800 domain-containing protein [Clostridioides sp. ES-W-0016-02]